MKARPLIALSLGACEKQPDQIPSTPPPHAHVTPQLDASRAAVGAVVDAANSKEAAAKEYTLDNTVADCVDVAVESTPVAPHHLQISLSALVRKNIGTCGCVSAVLRYRLLRGEDASLEQLATGTINSFRHTSKPFHARHRLRQASAPFVVQVACNG